MTCPPWKGGTWVETKGRGGQGHHDWAQKALKLASSSYDPRREVPCISMEPRDHMDTMSWGPSNLAAFYRDFQADLFRRDMYVTAFYVDARDVLHQFGDKYVEHLVQAEKVMLDLEKANRLKLSDALKAELEKRQELVEKKQLMEIALAEKKLNELEQKKTLLKSELDEKQRLKGQIEERRKELERSGLTKAKVREEVDQLSQRPDLQLEKDQVDLQLQRSLEARVETECVRIQAELTQRLEAELNAAQYRLSLEQSKRVNETYRLGMHM